MMIEDVIKKSILPLAFILFWFWIVSTIMKVSGKTDLFWWIFLSGLPFGIHKMRLILIPKGMDITATLGMAALSVIIGASEAGMNTLVGILGTAGFGQLNAFCLMIFCLLYIPCAAAMATIKREARSWKWMCFSAVFQLAVAWGMTFIIYHIGRIV